MAIGGGLVLLALAGAIPLFFYPSWATALSWIAVLIVAMTVDLLLAVSPRKVRFARRLPGTLRLGERGNSELFLHNLSSRTLRARIRDGWQPSAGLEPATRKVRLGAGERERHTFSLLPSRRGQLSAQKLTIRSFGPLRLAARQLTLSVPGQLVVLPPFHSRKHLPSKLRKLRELDGRAAVQIRGAGTEFDSLRDYVRGDDVRSIDWRATARRLSVVVRTWRPERDRRVLILLDTSRSSAARIQDEPRLDTGIEAALLLAVLAERGGDRVDFLAFDRRVRARVSSSQKGNLLNSLVHGMAPLEAELIEMDWERVPAQVRTLTPHRSLVVLLTSLESAAAEEGLLPAVHYLSQQHQVVIASVMDPYLESMRVEHADNTEVYRAAAAERTLLDRAALAAVLEHSGAVVVEAEPSELPPKLADAYIRLKAAGKL